MHSVVFSATTRINMVRVRTQNLYNQLKITFHVPNVCSGLYEKNKDRAAMLSSSGSSYNSEIVSSIENNISFQLFAQSCTEREFAPTISRSSANGV